MPQTLGNLPLNAKVKDTTSLYYGKPIIFQIKDKNHAGYPVNSVTLQTEKIICLKAFDGKETGSSDSNRSSYGNNRYNYSNISSWLNSDKSSSWFGLKHRTDTAPTSTNVSYNPYDTEAGFLYGFSADLRAALLSTTLTVARNTATDGGGSETITDKVFLASNTEVGLANENGVAEGTILAAYSNDASRIAYPTAEAVANSTYNGASTSSAWYWWLRTPDAANSYQVRHVYTGSTNHNNSNAYNGSRGVRPLCNLSSSILVSDTMDSNGTYTIMWNQLPIPPDGITTPDALLVGKTVTISWGASTDADGSISGYILERAVNGDTFSQIYKGLNRTFTDTVNASWTKAQYRVRAYDNNNAEGENTTSSVLNVISSNPPVISGSDTNLGVKTGAFSETYIVTNPDTTTTKVLTVVEKINGVKKRSYTATSGTTNTFSITADEWFEILNGTSTLSIVATDNFGESATRTLTFSKNVSEIEVTFATPLTADAAVTKAVMNITRQIPEGAIFTVEVCNNAYDDSPTWEDVTASIIKGSKFVLANRNKTAENWGFNVRIKVNRNGAIGDCYIRGIGGNFE